MSHAFRVAALAVVGLALAAHAPAQPAAPPAFTAFPDLRPADPVADPNELFARLRGVADRPLPPDATPAAAVRSHRLKAGLAYLVGTYARPQLGGDFDWLLLRPQTVTADDVYRIAAEGEPAGVRTGLFEERVRALVHAERRAESRVRSGTDPPEQLDFIHFHRLAAEAELLRLTGPG